RHGFDSEDERTGIFDRARYRQRGKDFPAAIEAAKPEHRARRNLGPCAYLIAEHGGPLLHFLAGVRHFRARAFCLLGFHIGMGLGPPGEVAATKAVATDKAQGRPRLRAWRGGRPGPGSPPAAARWCPADS